MTIKINVVKTAVPIEIGELKYEVQLDDKAFEEMTKGYFKFTEKVSQLVSSLAEKAEEEMSEEASFKLLNDLVSKAYDDILGEGSFDEVYTQTPRIVAVSEYLGLIYKELRKEMGVDIHPDVAKYLKKANKKEKSNK